jgi:hypothetical protein
VVGGRPLSRRPARSRSWPGSGPPRNAR